ncbi:unnamed protein product [Prorocentrum cordatum]|uniref:Endonuclease/exonuclease/phosphatase domain-containing protein n=1 Tax=Prorocentrum cordatum TaxID=2364126 RepID=A0ABN9WID9_9DINO|nr:unnamed protein product [Polarella glacialis]
MVLKVLSYNIWFSEHAMGQRMRAIGDLIRHHSPDLIAFQEMTVEHWNALTTADMSVERGVPEWHAEYQWSPVPPQESAGYFTVLGSRFPFDRSSKLYRQAFRDSSMGRDLLWLETEVPAEDGVVGRPVVFATSHLESLNMALARKKQAAEVFRMFERNEDVIFCGDTNIGIGEDIPLPEPWRDGWLEFLRRREVQDVGAQTSQSGGIHSGKRYADHGFTFDFSANEMVFVLDGWARANKARLRYDRFWLRLKNWYVADFDIIGDDPIPGGEMEIPGLEKRVPVYPSDHYGIVLTLAEKTPPTDGNPVPDAQAGTLPGLAVVSAVSVVSIAAFWLLGALDGKHAARIMNDTSMGEFFKYACDLISSVFLVVVLCSLLMEKDLDTQWYCVQSLQLVFLLKHYSAFTREAGLR